MDVIRQCRASGLTNQIWCEQHDISLKSYYYWLSKIRKLALEELPRKKNGIHMCTDQHCFHFRTETFPVPLLQPYFISDP
ncbi:IS66 family insertion sequence element accessory protein TnpA [Mediterraneibacter faecis]|uniref:IS66 family insertion sequence element accessory protein TnpA n=1 Tax=Mediterraneibacter faecis TaxID=592978 RepID=UPI003B52D088